MYQFYYVGVLEKVIDEISFTKKWLRKRFTKKNSPEILYIHFKSIFLQFEKNKIKFCKLDMSKKEKETQIQEFENVQNALSKSEAFVEKNQKALLYGFVALIVAVCAVLGYKNYYLVPKEREAQESIFRAEQYFKQDSLQLALDGDIENLGFLAIIDKYKGTNTAKLAKAYAGVCYKSLGEYDKAYSYLKNFKAGDIALTPALKGAIGDCHLEMGEKDKAIRFFLQAAAANNDVISPIYLQRAGLVYFSMGDYKKAVATFEEIKKKYASSPIAAEVDRYIQLATAAGN